MESTKPSERLFELSNKRAKVRLKQKEIQKARYQAVLPKKASPSLEFGHFERVTLGKFQSFQNTDGTQLRRGLRRAQSSRFVGQAAYTEQE
jgi:hypothetical protein